MVNINTSFGWKHVVDRIKMVNASQFKELYSEQLVNEKNPAFDFFGWNADTNWQDEVLQNGFITNNNISLTELKNIVFIWGWDTHKNKEI